MSKDEGIKLFDAWILYRSGLITVSAHLQLDSMERTITMRYKLSIRTLGKTHKSIFPEKRPLDVWGEGVYPCDVSPTHIKYRFFATFGVKNIPYFTLDVCYSSFLS